MAGNGPPPNESRARKRDEPVRESVRSDGKLGGFPLPAGVLPILPKAQWSDPEVPEREEWHPVTVQWWENWRRSPQGTRMLTEPDWDYLLDTALLHHQMWMSGGKNSERAAEIRLRAAEFGATPAARARLRMEVEVPDGEAFPAGNEGNVTDIQHAADRRKRVAGGL